MTLPDLASDTKRAPAQAAPSFGPFALQRLLGKSAHTLVWLALERDSQLERVLVMPRAQTSDAAQLQRHLQAARKAARVAHPGLAAPVAVGEHDGWPYIAYERGQASTLTELAESAKGLPPLDVARWSEQVLSGLAFAHEAGLAHRDIQSTMVLVDEASRARLVGLEVAAAAHEPQGLQTGPEDSVSGLQAQRRAAERDVLAFGLVLHHALCGQYALEQPDIAAAMALMPPQGRELVRLPWTTARPVPEALRVIANRATDRHERQRYRSARTLARALEGWIQAQESTDGGALALLADRLRSNGALPSLPGAARRAARLALLERGRTSELAEIVLQDPALSFELLRAVNTAEVRAAMLAGSGPVLTMRRAIAMVGLDGVRRAALALREWPGPLDSAGAAHLERALERAQRGARIAQLLRPPAYDAEVVRLLTLLQCLGRLVTHYHFPEEAVQIERLMQPVLAEDPDKDDEPGMSEESAALAVLGVDMEAIGAAVARHWGLDESVLHMIRRFGPRTTVRAIESDDDLLRALASCANEVVDATTQPARYSVSAMQRVAQRYGRALSLTLRDLQLAAQGRSPHDADDERDNPRTTYGAV